MTGTICATGTVLLLAGGTVSVTAIRAPVAASAPVPQCPDNQFASRVSRVWPQRRPLRQCHRRGHERVGHLGTEALGLLASGASQRPVQGTRVRLKLGMPLRDGDGRLLAYIYAGDLVANAEL